MHWLRREPAIRTVRRVECGNVFSKGPVVAVTAVIAEDSSAITAVTSRRL